MTAGIVWLSGVMLLGATVLPLWHTHRWWVRVFDFPRPHLAVLAMAVALWAIMALDRRAASTWFLVAALGTAVTYQVAWLRLFTPLHPVQAQAAADCATGARLSVLIANVLEENRDAGLLLREVAAQDPDIVLVMEADRRWIEALAPLGESYPHHLLHPRDDTWGIALYSRLDLGGAEVRYLVSSNTPSIRAALRLPAGGEVTLYGLHPKPPIPGRGTRLRDAEFLHVAREMREARGPALVVGDLNDVAWSRSTARLREVGGLLDPRIGRGFVATFPTYVPGPLRLPIDHVLFTPGISLLAMERLGDIGSDHLPVMARLCVPAPAVARSLARAP